MFTALLLTLIACTDNQRSRVLHGAGVSRDVCDVLFKGEVWRADTIQLRVVSDGERG